MEGSDTFPMYGGGGGEVENAGGKKAKNEEYEKTTKIKLKTKTKIKKGGERVGGKNRGRKEGSEGRESK